MWPRVSRRCLNEGALSVGKRKYVYTMLSAVRVLNSAVNESKQRIILATANVDTRVDVRTTLTNEDSTGGYSLTTKALAAQTLSVRVTAVTGRAKTFLCAMSITYFLQFSVRCYSAAGASTASSVVAALRARDVA